jgi:hypothetical protein
MLSIENWKGEDGLETKVRLQTDRQTDERKLLDVSLRCVRLIRHCKNE